MALKANFLNQQHERINAEFEITFLVKIVNSYFHFDSKSIPTRFDKLAMCQILMVRHFKPEFMALVYVR